MCVAAIFFVFKLFYVSNFFLAVHTLEWSCVGNKGNGCAGCSISCFFLFLSLTAIRRRRPRPRSAQRHAAIRTASHHTALSRPRIHQSSNCRRAHTRAHTGVVVWKRAQAAYTNTHTENKTAGGSSPQQNILSARRWLRVLVCVCVFRSIYKCIYASVYVCMHVCRARSNWIWALLLPPPPPPAPLTQLPFFIAMSLWVCVYTRVFFFLLLWRCLLTHR